MAQRNTIRILGAILIVVLLIAGAIVWLLPSAPATPSPVTDTTVPLFSDDPAAPTGSFSGVFDLTVFERSAYTILNHQLINEGSLPVQPPATVGKANPFI